MTITDSDTDSDSDTTTNDRRPARPVGSTRDRDADSRQAWMVACLQALIAANAVQVAAGFANADPSPPDAVVPGIAATAVVGIVALGLVRAGSRWGAILGIVFCLASLVGMGPHKLFLADGGVIAPLALVGFALETVFVVHAVRMLRALR